MAMPGTNTRRTLLVSVRDSLSVMAIDLATGDTVGVAKMGEDREQKPHEFALSPDGRFAFASIYGNGPYGANTRPGKEIAVIDLMTMTRIGTVDIDLYRAPHGVAADGDGMIWVTTERNHSAIVIDPTTRAIVRNVWMQVPVHFVAAAPGGRTMWFAHKEYPFVTAVDVARKAVIGRVDLPIGAQSIKASPDGRFLYVGDFHRPLLHVVDVAAMSVARTVPLVAVPGWPYATPDGRFVVVTTWNEPAERGFVEIFAAADLASVGVVECGAEPFHATVSDDGDHIYVALADGRIPLIDLARATIAEDSLRANGTGAEQVMIVDL